MHGKAVAGGKSGGQVTEENVVEVLLLASQLEMKVKSIFKRLLEAKEEKWNACKEQARGR